MWKYNLSGQIKHIKLNLRGNTYWKTNLNNFWIRKSEKVNEMENTHTQKAE